MGFYRGPQIVTNGLVMYLDAGNTKSYPGTGVTWYDRAGNLNAGIINNGTLTNGPTFSPSDMGSIVFDGLNDYAQMQSATNLPNWSYSFWYSTIFDTALLQNIFLKLSSANKLYMDLTTFSGLYRITLDPNGNLYTGTFGNYQYRDTISFLAQKINNNGTLNSLNFNFTASSAVSVHNILIKSDNSVGYLAGTNISRLSSFNTTTGAILLTNNNINAGISNIVLFLDEANNHIYLGGTFTLVSGVSYGGLARFDMDTLAVDSTFVTSTGFDAYPICSIKDANNKIYVVGGFTTYKGVSSRGIIRLNYDGSTDTVFNVGTGLNTIGDSLRIVIDSNNKPIVSGTFTTYNGTTKNRIIRLNNDGSIDNTFIIGTGFNNSVTDLKYDSVNNKIYAIGAFSQYNTVTANGIIRLNSDGSIDTGFSYGAGFSASMVALAIQADGKLLVGEGSINTNRTYTRTYNGSQFSSFIRLNYDGSIDSSFDAGLGYTQGTYRTGLSIGYKNSSGVPTILTTIGNGPGAGGRLPLSFFQSYYNNIWRQFTITKGADETYRVYNDGILAGTIAAPVGSNTALEMNAIWNRGNQANAMLYNRELSATEVLQNYNAIKSRFA